MTESADSRSVPGAASDAHNLPVYAWRSKNVV